jgi:hypothetical protein
MKKREFMEIIRVAVRKELNEFLPTLVSECVKAISTETIQETTDPVELTRQVLKTQKDKSRVVKKKTAQSEVFYSSNEVINNILNETTGGVPSEGNRVSGGSSESTQVDFNGNEVSVEDLPNDISTALTRDYSDLMSVIDKKKGNGG